MITATQQSKPFLKWAGGKTQLLGQFEKFFPLRNQYTTYLEPFVGSGAVFFRLQPDQAHLADSNEELINCYRQVKNHVEDLFELLRRHKRLHSTKHYYKVRSFQPDHLNPIERAARLIYLNKACFNGLYRVNSKGGFNVPMGHYTNPPILDETLLRSAHDALKGVGLHCMRFERFCDEFAGKGDFIYFDPPYFPLSRTSNFTSYTKDAFREEDQGKLCEVFEKLDKRGSFLMLSNSASDFIRDLYKKYKKTTHEVYARRAINCAGDKRSVIKELVILNRGFPQNDDSREKSPEEARSVQRI